MVDPVKKSARYEKPTLPDRDMTLVAQSEVSGVNYYMLTIVIIFFLYFFIFFWLTN